MPLAAAGSSLTNCPFTATNSVGFRVGSAAGAKDDLRQAPAGSKTRGTDVISQIAGLAYDHLSSLPPFLTLTAGLADDPFSSLRWIG